MFQATICPSSGENTVPMRHLVFVTLYTWLSGIQGPAYQTVINMEWEIPGVTYVRYFSWWWAHICPKHVEKSIKHIKKICAPSWFYLQKTQLLLAIEPSWMPSLLVRFFVVLESPSGGFVDSLVRQNTITSQISHNWRAWLSRWKAKWCK